MGTFLYAINDDKSKQKGMFPITASEADSLNKKGFGIFFNVQSFYSECRKIENLEAIRCIAIDIDCHDIPKENMLCKIKKSPLIPTLIVESKNGFHVYWHLKKEKWIYDEDKKRLSDNYRVFLKERFIPFFSGDKQACDVSRVLRMPGFYHMKDKAAPFLMHSIWECNQRYSIEEIKHRFKIISPVKAPVTSPQIKKHSLNESSIDFIKNKINIVSLSEHFGFKLVNRGSNFKTNCRTSNHKNGDKNPSLVIYPETNSFNCFGCGASGSQIDFYISQIEKVSINEVILNIKEIFK